MDGNACRIDPPTDAIRGLVKSDLGSRVIACKEICCTKTGKSTAYNGNVVWGGGREVSVWELLEAQQQR